MSGTEGLVLVTGAAGFIGYSVVRRLLDQGRTVVSIDNVNNYYDPSLKEARVAQLAAHKRHTLYRIDIADREALNTVFARHRAKTVIHLAAQAGVRYSLINPQAYIQSNIVGFTNILEACRHYGAEHLVYASTSSVYGANTTMPFSVRQNVDHPLTLYAASKKANELMAHTYSHLFELPTTGLRFFTVYGPWGRPDMMMFIFAKAILEGRPIELFNYGNMKRDFTYIDDIVEGVIRASDLVATADPSWRPERPTPCTSKAPYRIYNIGNSRPEELMRVVELLEERIGRKAIKEMRPMQSGDVPATWADVDDLAAAIGFRPSTPIEVGVAKFVDWYREYFRI